ncbi:MAG: efflux RND transporter periplasmic adaptor subunit [Chthonomonadales bacterium]|nr:efflux RND transporter periplasmic adaptor subunit [Chthonomonadales bacterium]
MRPKDFPTAADAVSVEHARRRLWRKGAPSRLCAARIDSRLALAAVMALAVSVSGCGRRPQMAEPASAEPAGVPVTVEPARSGTIVQSVEVTGSLVALQDVTVGARLAGKVGAVHLRAGDPVQSGQIVAMMDVSDYRAQLASAQASLESALTRQGQADALAEQATNQVKQAETNLTLTDRSTRAGLEVAKAALASAEQALAVIRQGARAQEREQAEQQVRAARANLNKAAADLKRMESLANEQAISASQLDQVRTAYEAAEASYRSAQETLSLVKEGARREDIRRAELAVDQAREGLKKAEADREMVELRKADVANARAGLRSAKAGVEAAVQAVRQARAAVTLANNNMQGAYVRSPISGYVAARMAEPGQQVGAGAPILRIVSPESVYFQATLSETQYQEVRPGQRVNVTIDALPDLKLTGRVTRILPVASAAARSFTLRVDFDRHDPRLRPEMFARGSVVTGVHSDAVLINKDAVVFDASNGSASVFVVGDASKATRRKVRLGYINSHTAEVLSGLKAGESVVIVGQSGLQDGDVVAVKQASAGQAEDR